MKQRSADQVADEIRRTLGHDELEPTPEADGPSWPQPLAAEAFHGLAGDVVRKIEPHTEADLAALLVQTLVYFGNAAGREPFQRIEADRHGLNEYVVLVGETSKARKGTSESHIRRLFESAAPEWIPRVMSGLSSGEGLVWQIRDAITKPNGEIEDPGVPDKRALVVQREFAEVLRRLEREGSSLSPTLRDAWDGIALASLVKNSPGRCKAPHISVIGHVTSEEVGRYLTRTETANGFGNRHLWICVRRSKLLPRGGDQVQWNAEVANLRAALNFAKTAGELKLTEEAWGVWDHVYGPLSAGRVGLLGAMLARAEAHVRRVSGIYAVLDRSRRIEVDHLLAALAVWDYAEASARYVFEEKLGDPDADAVLAALRQAAPDGMTDDGLREYFHRNWTGERRDRALRTLRRHHLAQTVREETEGRHATRHFATTPGVGDTASTASTAFAGTSHLDQALKYLGRNAVDAVDAVRGEPSSNLDPADPTRGTRYGLYPDYQVPESEEEPGAYRVNRVYRVQPSISAPSGPSLGAAPSPQLDDPVEITRQSCCQGEHPYPPPLIVERVGHACPGRPRPYLSTQGWPCGCLWCPACSAVFSPGGYE